MTNFGILFENFLTLYTPNYQHRNKEPYSEHAGGKADCQIKTKRKIGLFIHKEVITD